MRPARWKGWKLAAPSSALQSTWWKRLKWRLLWGARLQWRRCMEREGSISMGRGGSWDRSIVNWDLVVGWSREVGVFESQKRWKQCDLWRCWEQVEITALSKYEVLECWWIEDAIGSRLCDAQWVNEVQQEPCWVNWKTRYLPGFECKSRVVMVCKQQIILDQLLALSCMDAFITWCSFLLWHLKESILFWRWRCGILAIWVERLGWCTCVWIGVGQATWRRVALIVPIFIAVTLSRLVFLTAWLIRTSITIASAIDSHFNIGRVDKLRLFVLAVTWVLLLTFVTHGDLFLFCTCGFQSLWN